MRDTHYFVRMTEINGEYEYPLLFLIQCFPSELNDRLREIASTIRHDGGHWHDTVFYGDDGTAVRLGYEDSISSEDFDVMKKYLTVL